MADKCPITNLDRILLSTDGSEFSEGAVREAISLAKRCSSTLIAMSVIEVNPEYAAVAADAVEREELRVKETLEAVKSRAGEAGVEVETVVHEGEDPWKFITDEARNQQVQVIVMGRRGRTGLAKVAMGSVTARVIGHAPCDVLVVPRAGKVECRSVLVATDGSEFSVAAAREAIAMVRNCGGVLHAVSVASSDSDMPTAQQNVKMVAEKAAAEGIQTESITSSGKAYVEIIKAAGDTGADLIVVGCHGRTGLARLLMGSVAERVVGHAEGAVLVACA